MYARGEENEMSCILVSAAKEHWSGDRKLKHPELVHMFEGTISSSETLLRMFS